MKVKKVWMVSIIGIILINSLMGNTFIISLGGNGDEYGVIAIPTSDGNYLVGGNTNSFGAGGYDWIIVKVSGTGDEVIWAKTFGTVYQDYLTSIIEDSYGNYVAIGYTDFVWYGPAVLIKLDQNGNLLWQKSFKHISPATRTIYFESIIENSSGYVVAGYLIDTTETTKEPLLFSFSYDGNPLFIKALPTGSGGATRYFEHAWDLVPTNDNKIAIIGGSSAYNGWNWFEIWRMWKFDNDGTLSSYREWDWLGYMNQTDERRKRLIQSSTGDYIMVGGLQGNDFIITKFNTSLNHVWSRVISTSGNDYGIDVMEKDGNYFVSAVIDNIPCLLKFDPNGNLLWSKQLPYGVGSLSRTSDGGFITTGRFQGDITLTKFDENGSTCEEISIPNPVTIVPTINYGGGISYNISTSVSPNYSYSSTSPNLNSPNIICSYVLKEESYEMGERTLSNIYLDFPAFLERKITLKLSKTDEKVLKISIFDVSGKEVFSKFYNFASPIRISDKKLNLLPDGIYFLKVYSGKEEVGKFKLIKK